jgi:hypothetical protein
MAKSKRFVYRDSLPESDWRNEIRKPVPHPPLFAAGIEILQVPFICCGRTCGPGKAFVFAAAGRVVSEDPGTFVVWRDRLSSGETAGLPSEPERISLIIPSPAR